MYPERGTTRPSFSIRLAEQVPVLRLLDGVEARPISSTPNFRRMPIS